MLEKKKVAQGIIFALACGIFTMSPVDVDAAVRPTNIKWGAGETVETASAVQPVVRQEVESVQQAEQPVVISQTAPEEEQKTESMQVISAEHKQVNENGEEKDTANGEKVMLVKYDTPSQGIRIDSSLVICLDDKVEVAGSEEKQPRIIDISGGQIANFMNGDMKHKGHYVVIVRSDKANEMLSYQQSLMQAGIQFSEVNASGQIPADQEMRACKYLGTDSISAITFQSRDAQKDAEALAKKKSIWRSLTMGISDWFG